MEVEVYDTSMVETYTLPEEVYTAETTIDVVEEAEVVETNEVVEEYVTTQTTPAVAASTATATAIATREVN